MSEYVEQDFFGDFDFPEDEADETPDDNNIPAMQFLNQIFCSKLISCAFPPTKAKSKK
jgi:hypothetical protein